MNFAQLIDPQWVLAGCPAPAEKWRAQHVGVLQITTVVNGIQKRINAPAVPSRRDADAHLREVKAQQQAEAAAMAAAAAAATRAERRDKLQVTLGRGGLSKNILAALASTSGSLTLAQVIAALRAAGATTMRNSVSSTLSYLGRQGAIDCSGMRHHMRYAITPKGRARLA